MNDSFSTSAAPRRFLAAAAVAAVLLPTVSTGQDRPLDALPDDRRAGAETITEDALRGWLSTLASEEFAGRGTGQPGFAKAAAYMRDHFRNLGLEPANGESFFQRVPWQRDTPTAAGTALRVEGETSLTLGIDELRGEIGNGLEISGPLAFALLGSADGKDLPTFGVADGAARPAVVVQVRGGVLGDLPEQRRRRFGGYVVQQRIGALREAVEAAGGRLAALIDDEVAPLVGRLESRDYVAPQTGDRTSRGSRIRPPFLVITTEQATRIATAAGVADAWAEQLAAPGDAAPAPLVTTAMLHATITIESTTDRDAVPAENVLAILPGSDPELRHEYVAVGCHLDHLGVSGGTIHPGADDDGSGSAGLMAIAQALAKNPARPRRSVLFLAFCGEERGLIGSGYYARHPVLPLENMVAELQIDMIGRNESRGEDPEDNRNCLHLIGTEKLSRQLHEVCLRLNEQRAGFALEWDEEGVFYRSDHWNFARVGVPIAFFFTGFHEDYHRPTDTPDKIDYAKLKRISTYVYDLAYELADAADRPQVDADLWEALDKKGAAEPVAPVRGR